MPKRTSTNELNKRISEEGLKPFLARTNVLFALLSSDGKLISYNPAFTALKQTLPKTNTFRELVLPVELAEFDRLFGRIKPGRKVVEMDLEFGQESQPRRYSCLFIPLKDGHILFFGEPVVPENDLPEKYQRLMKNYKRLKAKLKENRQALQKKQIELKAVIAQADEVSHTDALTLLANRRQIISDLQRQVMFSNRYQRPFSISMLDFDHFKKVNDTYGHAAGDHVLRTIALQLRDHVRSPDIIGRYGGEEFLVLLPNSTMKAACEQAQRLCELVRSLQIGSDGHVIHMTISIGIAQYRIHQENWEQLLNRADQALYQAKKNGRDRWAVSEVLLDKCERSSHVST